MRARPSGAAPPRSDERLAAPAGIALRALFPRARRRSPVGVKQRGAKVERIAGDFTEQRQCGWRARRQAAGQPILLESEMRLKLLRQLLHADVFGQADDLDRFHAMIGGGAQDALEQLLADATPPVIRVDRERRLGMDVAPEWRLLAPDRLIGAQFGRSDQLAVDERAVDEVALAEATFGVTREELVRHAAAEAQMPTARVEAEEMMAERFFIRRPEPPELHRG